MSFPFEIYVIQATHGVVYGMLLFLVASGLTLVFGMMGVLNLAHASFYQRSTEVTPKSPHLKGGVKR